MNPSASSKLHQATLLTFERLGFMVPAEISPNGVPERKSELCARVRFRGAMSGELRLRTYGAVMPELTSNMLGITGPTTGPQQCDALAETVNVVCGNVLPAIAGPRAVFNLGSPKVGTHLLPRAKDADVSAELIFDEGHVLAELFFDEEIPRS